MPRCARHDRDTLPTNGQQRAGCPREVSQTSCAGRQRARRLGIRRSGAAATSPPPCSRRPDPRAGLAMIEDEQGSLPVAILARGRVRATKAGVKQAPLAPVCYLFRDPDDAVLYVGKSIALRDRLNSSFAKTRERKVIAMVRHARAVEWHTV